MKTTIKNAIKKITTVEELNEVEKIEKDFSEEKGTNPKEEVGGIDIVRWKLVKK